jgi:hypothetical protein
MDWNALLGKIAPYLLLYMALGCYIFSPVIAGNWTRPNASNLTAIPTIDESYTDTLMGEFTTNSSNVTNTTQILPNLPGLGYLAMSAYTDILGNVAAGIIFAIPFLMMWIMGNSVTLPSVIGIMEGGFILYRLPEQFHLVAVGFIALSVIAIIYSLLKEKM